MKKIIVISLMVLVVATLVYLGWRYWNKKGQEAATGQTSQTAAAYDSWSYAGDWPVSAVNITTFKMPDGRYAAYYVGGTPGVYNYKQPGRAFSIDGINWTVDTAWTCPDLCERSNPNQPVLPHRKHLAIKDGRIRTYVKSEKNDGIISYISGDGLVWQKEDGVRLKLEPEQLTAAGASLGQNFTPVYLADGRVRAYYEVQGQKPANLTDSQCCRVLASAISSDNGVTFTKEDGIRISSADYNQKMPSGSYNTNDPTVVAMDNGYRIFFGSTGLIMSAFSSDGLTFTRDSGERGLLPLWASDPSPLILPDGRLLVMDGSQQAKGSKSCSVSQYPDGCPENYDLTHMIVWGKLPFKLTANNWDNNTNQATVRIAGTQGKTAKLKVLDGSGNCKMDATGPSQEPSCSFDPQAYTISPTSGQLPFAAVIKRVAGATSTAENTVTIGAEIDNQTAIINVSCIGVGPTTTVNGCH